MIMIFLLTKLKNFIPLKNTIDFMLNIKQKIKKKKKKKKKKKILIKLL